MKRATRRKFRDAGLALLGVTVLASAAPAQVDLRLVPEPRDPAADSLTVGTPFWASVTARGPAGYALLPESVIEAYRPRPEVAVVDRDRRDGQLRLRLAVFRPGAVVLPDVRVSVLDPRGDTLRVPLVADTIHVASVLAPGDTLLADIKPLWTTPGWPWWTWAMLAAALIAIAALLWRRRRRRREPVAGRPVGNPYRIARERIAAVRAEPVGARERAAAAGEIGEALREYLAVAWAIPTLERTTFEWLPALPERIGWERGRLGSIFAEVDLVKYARVAPARGEIPDLAGRALESLDELARARTGTEEETETRRLVDRRAGDEARREAVS